MKIEVDLEDIEIIVGYWRASNEAPGGISPRKAINGMRDAVWHLELARRFQVEGPFVHHPDCHHKDGSAIDSLGGVIYCLTCERRKVEDANRI